MEAGKINVAMADSGLCGDCVYLLVERDYLRAGVPLVVKVGRSMRIEARAREYPKHSRLIAVTRVNDAVPAEAAILRAFTSDFSRRTDLGNEYFQIAGPSPEAKAGGVILAHHVFSKAVAEFVSLGPVYMDDADESLTKSRSTASTDGCDSAAETSDAPPPGDTVTPSPPPAPTAIDLILAEFMQAVRVAHSGEWCSVEELYRWLNEWMQQRDASNVCITCARMLSGINALYRPTWERRDDVMKMRVPRQAQAVADVQDTWSMFIALADADERGGAGSGTLFLKPAHDWAVSVAAVKKAYDAFLMAMPREARARNAVLDDGALIRAGFVLHPGVHCCHACGHRAPRGERCCHDFVRDKRVKKKAVMAARLVGLSSVMDGITEALD